MSNDNEITEIIDKFIDIKDKISELEKKHEKYRKLISEYMFEQNTSSISHISKKDNKPYTVKKTLSARQTVSKDDLPKEIWEKYAKTSTFHIIRIDEDKGDKGKKKERSDKSRESKLFDRK